LITSVAQYNRFAAMQQRMCMSNVRNIAGSTHHRMHKAARHINAYVRFHVEMSLLTFPGLVYFGGARTVMVFGRRRGRDQAGIYDGSCTHHQTFACQMGVDFIENSLG